MTTSLAAGLKMALFTSTRVKQGECSSSVPLSGYEKKTDHSMEGLYGISGRRGRGQRPYIIETMHSYTLPM